MMNTSIPKRWFSSQTISEDPIANLFLAFKTPLDAVTYNHNIPAEYQFTPQMVFDHAAKKKLTIKAWIDLTNTNRFYKASDISKCQYIKIPCIGYAGEYPGPNEIAKFNTACCKLIMDTDATAAAPTTSVIAVHCTNGENRTGFLISIFLVEHLKFNIHDAIELFRMHKHPGITKPEYLKYLYTRYAASSSSSISISSSSTSKGLKRDFEYELPSSVVVKKNKKTPQYMPGIVLVENEQEQFFFKNIITKMCNWIPNRFVGCQPVSMNLTSNIMFLTQMPNYRVSWKADGVRFLLLITNNVCIFVNRNFDCFKPIFTVSRFFDQHSSNILLDGEMVVGSNGNNLHYFAYDILYCNNKDVKPLNFDSRMEILSKLLTTAAETMANDSVVVGHNIYIHHKRFWPIKFTRSLLKEYKTLMTCGGTLNSFQHTILCNDTCTVLDLQGFTFTSDGLIFQPFGPYVCGVCEQVLKWKEPFDNTIDFRLIISKNNYEYGELHVGEFKPPFAKIKLLDHMKCLDNRIIACKFVNKEWHYVGERTDKQYPNSYKTAQRVFDSILYPVTEKFLLKVIEKSQK